MVGRKTTQQNLAAVLAQLNSEQPTASPLLSKAVSVHGKVGEMTQSPLKNREVAAYRSLEEWVRLTFHDKTPVPNKPSLVTEQVGTGQAIVTREAVVSPEPVADPVDPFDPVVFNRQMHSKK
jgi:hypothetical protein